MISIIVAMLSIAEPVGLVAEPAVWSAGVVRTGPALVKVFTIQNKGPHAIELVSADSGCGCAKPSLDQKTLAVGESTKLTMSVNTLTQPAGNNSWKTTIRYRLVREVPSVEPLAQLELRISAELVREVSLHPPELAISTTSTAQQTLTLRDIREKPLKVLRVATTHPAVRVQATATKDSSPAEYTFRLDLDESYPVRQQTETVTFFTDDPACRELTMPVKIDKREKSAYRVSSEGVDFRLSASESSGSRLVQIRSLNGEAIRIDKVESPVAAVSAKWSSEAGPVVTVRVLLNDAKASGETVLTVQLGRDTVKIPVRWMRVE